MYVIGLDFGTLSVRAVLVDLESGSLLSTAVDQYRHGVIDNRIPESGIMLKPQWALQEPQDWLGSMTAVVRSVLRDVDDVTKVIGLGMDSTSSTVLPVLKDGTLLSWLPEWRDKPHAWPKLWKHSAAQDQATRLTEAAVQGGENWLARCGGRVPASFLMPKALQILEEAPDVYNRMDLLVEGGDWLAWQLTGNLLCNSCAAGLTGFRHEDESPPSREFLSLVHPGFADFYTAKVGGDIATPGSLAGTLLPRWAERFGLTTSVKVAVPTIDGPAGAIGCGITPDGVLYLAMGTSTVHFLLGGREAQVNGIAGVVKDAIIPGWFAYAATQVATGDMFNWFTEHVGASHESLTEKAARLRPGETGLLVVDWWNGSRMPLVDADLGGTIIGYTLHTSREAVYRALIEATAFGVRQTVESFRDAELPVRVLRVSGGLAQNEMLLQIYADVTDLPVEVCATEQAAALGAAVLGAVAAGAFGTVTEAISLVVPPPGRTVQPIRENHNVYDSLYAEYARAVELLGRDPDSPVKRLRALQRRV